MLCCWFTVDYITHACLCAMCSYSIFPLKVKLLLQLSHALCRPPIKCLIDWGSFAQQCALLFKSMGSWLHLFDQKYSKNITLFYFKYILKSILFLWWQSWIFSIITPVFSVIHQKIILICWFAAQATFCIMKFKKFALPFVETMILFSRLFYE